jgi:hypothetical protein
MTDPAANRVRGRAPSGARYLGDDYQHLLTWLYAAQLLRRDPRIVKVELEKYDAGNVDDLVVHRREGPGEYHQVKFSTKPAEDQLSADWFTERGKAKKSPLERFHESWKNLAKDDVPPQMVFHTNRVPAAKDPILSCLSGDTALLVPGLERASGTSTAGKARTVWAKHLGTSEAELLEMLNSLQIRAARESLAELQDHCRLAMDAVGLLISSNAIDQGMIAARRWIEEGVREVVAETVSQLVDERHLRATEPRAFVLIQALARDPLPELATVALDWVDYFVGDNPGARRETTSPEVWNQHFAPELAAAEQRVRQLRDSRIRLTGAFRLTTAMYAGTVFSDTAGYTLAMAGRSGGGEWFDVTSEGDQTPVPIETIETVLGRGNEIAVGLSVSADVTDDVLNFLEREQIPVGHFVNLRVAEPGRTSLLTANEMRGWAATSTDALRALGRATPDVVHVFVSAPRPAAMLLGHQWNRMPRTQLWEELPPGRYMPSFTIS